MEEPEDWHRCCRASGLGPDKADKWRFDKKKLLLNGLRARKGLSHSPRRQQATGWNGTRCERFVILRVRPAANSVCPPRPAMVWSLRSSPPKAWKYSMLG